MERFSRTLFFTLVSVAFAAAGAKADHRSCAAAGTFLDFIIQVTDYLSLSDCPQIQLASREEVSMIVGALESGTRGSPVAAYLHSSNVILLSSEIDLANPMDQSFVVHELVHALQFQTGAAGSEPCVGALEADAYRVQAAYLEAEGLSDQAKAFWSYGLAIGSCAYAYHPEF